MPAAAAQETGFRPPYLTGTAPPLGHKTLIKNYHYYNTEFNIFFNQTNQIAAQGMLCVGFVGLRYRQKGEIGMSIVMVSVGTQ